MQRLSRRAAIAALAAALLAMPAREVPAASQGGPRLAAPIWAYNDWSAYDELSDHVPLTEDLALREFAELLRLRQAGVRFDYYVMDAFWYEPGSGYRQWRKAGWPDGPDRWLALLKENGIKPGLWFGSNSLTGMEAPPQWRSSLDADGTAMAFYAGGFLPDFMRALELWYDRGIRVFKFDFANFDVAAKGDEAVPLPEIRARNVGAFHAALAAFRSKHPDAVMTGFNGFVDEMEPGADPLGASYLPWEDVFDSIYSGDPRPSNVPEMSFWRSVDIYSDQMVRNDAQAGLPFWQIDSTSVMLGDTGTNYHRKTDAWRSGVLLMLAHGGWTETVHGNLEFLDRGDARWLARVQALYAPLVRARTTRTFGGAPGGSDPYGFSAEEEGGALYTVVNPTQSVAEVRLPLRGSERQAKARVLFRDAGFEAKVEDDKVRLGPGQLALVGIGRFCDPRYDLGVERDIRIPRAIEPVAADFRKDGEANAIEATVVPPSKGDLRIVLRQRDPDGSIMRSVSHAKMGVFFRIDATEAGRALPVENEYDKVIWSGLAWAVGEIRHASMVPGEPITLRLSSADPDTTLELEGRVYAVRY